MKQYVVFHDYGAPEGWKIAGESDSLLEACQLREDDIRNGGGTSLIFESLSLFTAYERAAYEQRDLLRQQELARRESSS